MEMEKQESDLPGKNVSSLPPTDSSVLWGQATFCLHLPAAVPDKEASGIGRARPNRGKFPGLLGRLIHLRLGLAFVSKAGSMIFQT